MDIPIEELREQAKRMWAAGDYRKVGQRLEPAAQHLVAVAGVSAGARVLDVGTGTGNLALVAARAGAEVVAVDIADTWFPTVEKRARETGVHVELHLGDAEELPFGDQSFDAVLSCFAAVFAPRHGFVAAELARVCRAGGIVGMTAWPREASMNRILAPLQREAPPPPSYATPYERWAELDHARAMFAAHGVDIEAEDGELTWEFDSRDEFERWTTEASGPIAMAKAALEEEGRWAAILDEMRAGMDEVDEAPGDAFRIRNRYRILHGRRSAT